MRADMFERNARDLATRKRLDNPFGLRVTTRSGAVFEGAWSWSVPHEILTITHERDGAKTDTAIPLAAIDAFEAIDIGTGVYGLKSS